MDNSSQVRKAIAYDLIYNFDRVKARFHEQDPVYEGHRKGKIFFRVNTKQFDVLVDELKNNPNCGYYTYMNGPIKEGLKPRRLSCMLKQLRKSSISNKDRDDNLAVNEVLTSQILNYYNCSTVFNKPIIVKDKNGVEEYKILSVDFVNDDIEFMTFEGKNGFFIWESLDWCNNNIERKLFKDYPNLTEESKQKFKEQFMISFIVRRYILNDADFKNVDNHGIILNKDKTKIQYLNFDFEYSFRDIRKHDLDWITNAIRDNLEYIYINQPKAFKILKIKTDIFYNELSKLISTGEFVFANDYHETVVNKLKDNLENISRELKFTELKLLNTLQTK